MSSYTRVTKNPNTGRFEDADWLDNYFGQYKYGVRFPSNPTVVFKDNRCWQFGNEKDKANTKGG